MKYDKIDEAILEILTENAKFSMKEIAEQVGLTVTPTFERIKKLEREGIIEHYTIKKNLKKLGKGIHVICLVSLKEHNIDLQSLFEESAINFEEVTRCYHITGDYDYWMEVHVADMDEYEKFLKHKLTSIPSISSVQSNFVLSQIE